MLSCCAALLAFCEDNPLVTSGLFSQRDSNEERISMSRRRAAPFLQLNVFLVYCYGSMAWGMNMWTPWEAIGQHVNTDDSRFAPSQWETALLCNAVSHWLGASLESTLVNTADPGLLQGALVTFRKEDVIGETLHNSGYLKLYHLLDRNIFKIINSSVKPFSIAYLYVFSRWQ